MKPAYLKRVCLLFLFSFVFVLAGCDAPASSSALPDASVPSSDSLPEPAEKLSLITSPNGLIFTSLAAAPDGFYEIIPHQDWTANIFYTDYETRQKVYLSSQPSSLHNDETDESFIPTTVGGVLPACDGKYLYVFKIGNSELARVYGEDGQACIWRADLNGAHRLEMRLPANMALLDGSCVVSDGHALYAVGMVVEGNEEKYQLVRLDLEAQRIEVLEDLSPEQNHFLVGAQGDCLMMKSITKVPAARTQEELLERLSDREHILYLYNPYTGARVSLKSWKQGQMAEIFDTESLYFYTSNGQLEQVDPKTGDLLDTRQIVFPEAFEDANVMPETQIFDRHIIFRITSDQTQERYGYDLATGEMKELTLQFNKNPMPILLETDDFFVVQTGDQQLSYADTASDGAPFTNTQLISVYSLIAKEDYWHNRPNYIALAPIS